MNFPGAGPVEVRWYVADKSAVPLPFPTVYNSTNWIHPEVRPAGQPGEIAGSPRPWDNGATPDEQCQGPKGSKAAFLGDPAPLILCHEPERMHGGITLGGRWPHGFGDSFDGAGGVAVNGSGHFGTGWLSSGGVKVNGAGVPGSGWLSSGGVKVNGAGVPGSGWPASGGVELNSSGPFGTFWKGEGGVEVNGSGTFTSVIPDDMPIGTICYFGSATPPTGWLVCDGSAKPQATYPALYALLGTTFGPDTGGNFTLPDLQSRIPVGAGHGSGLSSYTAGATGGEETHLLTTAETPSHSHSQAANTVLSSGGAIPAPNVGLSTTYAAGGTTGNAGGGGSHNNIQPYLALTPIIRAL